jgi:hypothetical protein
VQRLDAAVVDDGVADLEQYWPRVEVGRRGGLR